MITLQKIKPEDKLLFVLVRQKFLHTHQKKVLDIYAAVKRSGGILFI